MYLICALSSFAVKRKHPILCKLPMKNNFLPNAVALFVQIHIMQKDMTTLEKLGSLLQSETYHCRVTSQAHLGN